MNTLKIKQIIAAFFLVASLTIGSGIVAEEVGLDFGPAIHACEHGMDNGGGC